VRRPGSGRRAIEADEDRHLGLTNKGPAAIRKRTFERLDDPVLDRLMVPLLRLESAR
jgi:hypothetical protein